MINPDEKKEQTVSGLMYRLNFCCCGNPEEFLKYLYERLKFIGDFDRWEEKKALFQSTGEYYLFHYWLDAIGFSEHGGSVNGSWLTPEGSSFLSDLETYIEALPNEEPK